MTNIDVKIVGEKICLYAKGKMLALDDDEAQEVINKLSAMLMDNDITNKYTISQEGVYMVIECSPDIFYGVPKSMILRATPDLKGDSKFYYLLGNNEEFEVLTELGVYMEEDCTDYYKMVLRDE